MDTRYTQTRLSSEGYSLEQTADAANFVVIQGLAIDVDDLVDAIHGKLTDPILTRAELTTCYGQEYNTDFIESVVDGIQRRIDNLKKEKLRRIKNLLMRSSIPMSNGVSNIKLPRREQILIALSRGQLLYSSLAEFLGQFAELSETEAGLVKKTIDEVNGDLLQVQPATHLSSRSLDQIVRAQELAQIEKEIGIKQLGELPVFLLERAAFEIPPHFDDFQYFEEIRGDRGVHVGFSIESTIGNLAFAGPLFTFVGSLIAAQQGWIPWETLDTIVSPEYIPILGAGAATKLALTFSRWTPITDRIRASAHTHAVKKSARTLQSRYKELEDTLNKLKKTVRGRLLILHLREWLSSLREPGKSEYRTNVHEIAQWEKAIESDPALGERFDAFCAKYGNAMDTMEAARRTWAEFQRYQEAVAALPPFEEATQRQARGTSAAQLKS